MVKIRIELLGCPSVTRGGKPVPPFKSRKVLGLVAYLALNPEPHSRSRLAGILWSDTSEQQALANLRFALWNLQRVLGVSLVHAERTSIELRATIRRDGVFDTDEFFDALRAAESHPAESPAAIAALERAVALYRGDLLAGWDFDGLFDEWLQAQRVSLREAVLDALYRLANYYTAQRRLPQAIAATRRLLVLDPWREQAHRQLMWLLARDGQHNAALAQYETCRHLLQTELGVAPMPETIALAERIRSARNLPRHNVPLPLTPFIGRETELAEIARLVRNGDCRLLTLAGIGGIGKTRLAMRAAIENADEFLHGVCFVPLAAVTHPDALMATLAKQLGCSLEGTRDVRARLVDFLRDKEMLIVLDNFEQLRDHSDLIIEILKHAPLVKWMVTSRERLNLSAEWVFQVEGLEYPRDERGKMRDESTPLSSFLSPLSSFDSYSAVQLFLQSARRVATNFQLSEADRPHLARLCRFLNGMPLGIELAAAFVREYPLARIAQQLEANLDFLTTTMRDVPAAHTSLRAVFEYSWGLLSAEERAALARLAVFCGGCTEAAARAVGVLAPALIGLVNKFLLQRAASGRYLMLEPVRQFAAEKLGENRQEEQTTRERHAGYYAEFLRARVEGLKRGDAPTLTQVTEEIENVRAAWLWACATHQITLLARAMDGLAHLYEMRNWFQEGEAMLAQAVQALSTPPASASLEGQRARGRALTWQGMFAHRLARYPQARESAQAGLEIARALNQSGDMSFALNVLGNVADRTGNLQDAIAFYQQSVTLAREMGEAWEIARSLSSLGWELYLHGEYDKAQATLDESLALRRQAQDKPGIARTLINLGMVAAEFGQFSQAEKCYRESMAIFQELDIRMGVAICLNNLGFAAYRQKQYAQARELYQQGLVLRQELGDRWGISIALENLGTVACASGDYTRARADLRAALEIAVEIHSARRMVETLVSVATLWAKQGQSEAAVELLGVALAHPAIGSECKTLGQTLAHELQATLPREVFDAARARRQTLPLEQVVAEVMIEIRD